MTHWTKLFAVAVCGIAMMQVVNVQAASADYAMTTVENVTSAPVSYQYRWGTSGPWQDMTLQPGTNMTHYVSNNGYVPWLYFRFDSITGDGAVTALDYQLASYTGSATKQAKLYRFQLVGWQQIDLRWIN